MNARLLTSMSHPQRRWLPALLAGVMLVLLGCGLDTLFPTELPPAASVPASTPVATATVTVDPDVTHQHEILQLVTSVAHNAALTVTVGNGFVTVTETYPAIISRSACLQEVFILQRAVWTKASFRPDNVLVELLAPRDDVHGTYHTTSISTARVSAAIGASLSWSQTSAQTAWDHYDEVWLYPGLT